MKLIALNALVAAVEDGSLRSAAARLGLSQPALSKMIRELELEVGASLLTRTSQGVAATAQGQVLYLRAKAATKELSLAQDEITQMSGQMRGQLAISAAPVAVMLLIPEALRTFSREFADINLRISEHLYFEQLEQLRRGDVQVAVGGIPKGLPSGEFVVESLMDTTMLVVVKKGSPLLRPRTLADLAEARWVYTGATREEGYAKLLFEAHGLAPPKLGALVNSTLTLLALVGSGDYVGLLPQEIAHTALAQNYVSVVPVRERGLDLNVGAMVKSNAAVSPSVRQFITHLHRAAHQLTKA